MRKLFAICIALVSLVVFAVPAQANIIRGQRCDTYTNTVNTRRVTLCRQVIEGTGGSNFYWAEFTGNVPNGWLSPDHVVFDGKFWSSKTGGAPWCLGNNDNCNGPYISTANEPTGNFTVDGTKFGPNQHYCTVHAEMDVTIYWTVNSTELHDLNSDNFNTVPNCTL